MLSKVCVPNNLATNFILNFINIYDKNNLIEKIQDNLEGYFLIKYKNGKIIIYNYYLNKFYAHKFIQINFNDKKIIKQIDSFDQNNTIIASKMRLYVLKCINNLYQDKFNINSILGIGGEYYLYWIFFNNVKNLIGISNSDTIINDAKLNIPWSNNYLVDYNNIKSYPKIIECNIILINLFQINNNVIEYIKNIKFDRIIIISCNLSNNKLKTLVKYFLIKKIKYFRNFDGLIRIIEFIKK
jgi:tRNA/tmRNA/rRNA uracil-C5-methylase (TrmA/RlmC/RlmD family)